MALSRYVVLTDFLISVNILSDVSEAPIFGTATGGNIQVLVHSGHPGDRAYIPLATRRGTVIPNETRQERAPAQLRAAVEMHGQRATARLRSITAVYNCMGSVFASRRTWVDPDHLSMILREDGYRELATGDEVKPGDVLIYRNSQSGECTHVGTVVAVDPDLKNGTWDITVMSKWGADGEYFHSPDDVPPFLGEPAEYWTDRKECP